MPHKTILTCKDMLTTWGRSSRCRRGGIIDGGHHGEVGYFIEPTVIVGARPGMTVVEKEIFGLVITVQRFDSTEEVVAVAYGLAGGLWTRDLALAIRSPRSCGRAPSG
ncbi:aldehyde dehydrogenase family protein [Saccharopolyspora terrae]|uniref:Aldehyde dehydrogenase family protein n=1 Tax=Saccharopolyspora terrae TaxID=2530384 RepID=A0A4R4VHL5_9PSEU|nr:aldehyde dehydrogenase family protein [Saccharopolyspora terrae]